MNESVQNMLNSLANIGLRVIAWLAILVVGWIIAKIIGNVVGRLLDRVGFNRLADRTGIRRWTGNYTPSGLVGKLVYYTLLLFTLQIAFSVFGPNPISDVINTIIAWLPRLLVATVIVVVAVAIANAVFDIITNALSQLSYGKALARAAQIVIIALGAIAALNQIGVATTVTMPVLITILATIGGIAIVGVGGGLIQPMRQRWERMLNSAEREGSKLKTQMRQGAATEDMKTSRTDMVQPPYVESTADTMRDVKGAQPATTVDETTGALRSEPRPGQNR